MKNTPIAALVILPFALLLQGCAGDPVVSGATAVLSRITERSGPMSRWEEFQICRNSEESLAARDPCLCYTSFQIRTPKSEALGCHVSAGKGRFVPSEDGQSSSTLPDSAQTANPAATVEYDRVPNPSLADRIREKCVWQEEPGGKNAQGVLLCDGSLND